MLDTKSLVLFGSMAALLGEIASTILETRAKLRGRPSPPPFSPMWTVRALVILTGAFVFSAGAVIWDSLLIMVIGAGIALAGILFGLADKARRAFTDW